MSRKKTAQKYEGKWRIQVSLDVNFLGSCKWLNTTHWRHMRLHAFLMDNVIQKWSLWEKLWSEITDESWPPPSTLGFCVILRSFVFLLLYFLIFVLPNPKSHSSLRCFSPHCPAQSVLNIICNMTFYHPYVLRNQLGNTQICNEHLPLSSTPTNCLLSLGFMKDSCSRNNTFSPQMFNGTMKTLSYTFPPRRTISPHCLCLTRHSWNMAIFLCVNSPGVTCTVTGWLWLLPFWATNEMLYRRPDSKLSMWAEFLSWGRVLFLLLAPVPSRSVWLGETERWYLSMSPWGGSHWTTAVVVVFFTTWRFLGPEITEGKEERENVNA